MLKIGGALIIIAAAMLYFVAEDDLALVFLVSGISGIVLEDL